jgi:hypothetical protein
MSVPEVPDLIKLLGETLKELERIEGIRQDDPTLIGLKRYIVLIIAELRILRDGHSAA